MIEKLTELDFAVLDWIQDHLACPFLDTVMPLITALGNVGIIWILTGLLLCCTRKYRTGGIIMLLGLVVGVVLGNGLLKNLVARSRPCWIRDWFHLLIAVPHDFSFPSGHTLSSTIGAVTLMGTNKRLGVPACVLAALIAFSRLYLYVHFPSDVLFAVLLGIIIGLLVLRLRPGLKAVLVRKGWTDSE